jgi:adenine-specific DNA-methyltransferase
VQERGTHKAAPAMATNTNKPARPPKGKLELTWVGKENHPRLEPRILVEDPKLSYGKSNAENILIHGDNLLALKALEQDFEAKIKCIYIDPPYNTGSAFAHYDDGLEHSIWLSMIRDSVAVLRTLLAEDGSIWINLDDNEAHYCKVMCDEVFGRSNFLCDIAWEKRYSPPPDTKDFGYIHDHILCYRKSPAFERNLLPLTEDQAGRYKNPDKDPRGPWKAMDYTCRYSAEERPNLYYSIKQPNTRDEIWPKKTRVWAMSKDVHETNEKEKRIWWGVAGKNSVPSLKNFLSEINQGMMPMSLWKHTLAGHNQDAKKEAMAFRPDEPFSTPKPEKLLQVVLCIATKAGDFVLDSFAGSGTTGAVAHKMGRRWIMVELGEHCYTHIVPRLKKVIDGSDQGGISQAIGWKGGGGFKFYRLAESLLVKDRDLSTAKKPVYVINPKYDANMLIRAICKIENFRFLRNNHWHGISSEHHFLYVTTNLLSQRHLDTVSAQLGEGEALLVYCTRRASGLKVPDNIEVKKIPRDLLAKCTFEEDRV